MTPLFIALAFASVAYCYVREPVELAVPNSFDCTSIYWCGTNPPDGEYGWKTCRYTSEPRWLDCARFAAEDPPPRVVWYLEVP